MIVNLYTVECGGCGYYLARPTSAVSTVSHLRHADLFRSEHNAVAHAAVRGWSTYPLLCPSCNEKRLAGVEVRDPWNAA